MPLLVHITYRYRFLIKNFCCYPEVGKTVAWIRCHSLVILWLSFAELLGQLVNNSAAVFHNEIVFVIQGIHDAALVTGTALALIALVIAFIGYRKLKKSILKTSIAGENV